MEDNEALKQDLIDLEGYNKIISSLAEQLKPVRKNANALKKKIQEEMKTRGLKRVRIPNSKSVVNLKEAKRKPTMTPKYILDKLLPYFGSDKPAEDCVAHLTTFEEEDMKISYSLKIEVPDDEE